MPGKGTAQIAQVCYNSSVKLKSRIEDASVWDTALLTLPKAHILQSWTWGAFKEHHQWQARRMLWREKDRTPLAAAQLLTQKRSYFTMGYIPKGPILDWERPLLVEAVLDDLEQTARQLSLVMLKIDPDVRIDRPEGHRIQNILKRRGWAPSFEQVQFRNTMIIDLQDSLETLLAAMKSKWRYNIRLAKRKGVIVREARRDELPLLYTMYAETALRDEFVIRDEAYYLEAWTAFLDAGLAHPLVAEVKGNRVAMLILLHFGKRAWYMYGASLDLYRNYMPNHLLQWEAIRQAKALGCATYDLWGAPDTLDRRDPMWGVYRFKQGFNAEFVPQIGAYDYAPRPLLYRLFAFLRPRIVALAERRFWNAQV